MKVIPGKEHAHYIRYNVVLLGDYVLQLFN